MTVGADVVVFSPLFKYFLTQMLFKLFKTAQTEKLTEIDRDSVCVCCTEQELRRISVERQINYT